MNKRNYSNGLDLPLGLSMAMSQNPQAMEYFTSLSGEEKEIIIGRTHAVKSKKEMQDLVSNMAETLNASNSSFTTELSSKFNI